MTDDVTVSTRVSPSRARRRLILWGVHSSGRFDRPDAAWGKALRYYATKGSYITGTEAAGRDPWLFNQVLEPLGWQFAHLSAHFDGAGEAECYAAWDNAVWEMGVHPFARKLTDLTWVRSEEYGGKKAAKVNALVVHLIRRRRRERGRTRSVVLIVVHMPLDNTAQRAAVWLDVCKGIVALKAEIAADPHYLGAEVVVVMDGNKNLRDHAEAGMVRQHLEKPLGMVTSWAHGLPKSGGTEGRQVIDYALMRRPVLAACELLRDLPDSDHRAFRYRTH